MLVDYFYCGCKLNYWIKTLRLLFQQNVYIIVGFVSWVLRVFLNGTKRKYMTLCPTCIIISYPLICPYFSLPPHLSIKSVLGTCPPCERNFHDPFYAPSILFFKSLYWTLVLWYIKTFIIYTIIDMCMYVPCGLQNSWTEEDVFSGILWCIQFWKSLVEWVSVVVLDQFYYPTKHIHF